MRNQYINKMIKKLKLTDKALVNALFFLYTLDNIFPLGLYFPYFDHYFQKQYPQLINSSLYKSLQNYNQSKIKKQIKLMLSNIVQNSHQLLKSQFNQDQSLLNQIYKLKNKKRNFSYFQSTQKRGSIFEEPQFHSRMNIEHIKKYSITTKNHNHNRAYFTSHTNRFKQTRQQSNSKEMILVNDQQKKDKLQTINSFYRQPKLETERKLSKFTMTIGLSNNSIMMNSSNQSEGKVIHSRKTKRCSISNKNPKLHHEKTLYQNIMKQKSKHKMAINNLSSQLIDQPGFINLCLYKNTLKQINNIKIANSTCINQVQTAKNTIKNRTTTTKKQSPRMKIKENIIKEMKSNKNKIKYVKYNGMWTDGSKELNSQREREQGVEYKCRPWSPDNNYDCHEMGNFRPFELKLEG